MILDVEMLQNININIKHVVFKLYRIYSSAMRETYVATSNEFNKNFRGGEGRGDGEQSPVGALCGADKNALSHFTSYRLHLDANAGA